jgi:hypothetical protein
MLRIGRTVVGAAAYDALRPPRRAVVGGRTTGKEAAMGFPMYLLSFDELLAANGAAVEAEYGGALDDEAVKGMRFDFDDLTGFYAAAKVNGAAVMKWVAF